MHSVTTYKSSVGAPVFTVWMNKNDVPYLRFVGMHLGNKDLPLKTKVLITLAPIMEKGKKHENTTNVEINVGIKTNMIEKKLRNELKPNGRYCMSVCVVCVCVCVCVYVCVTCARVCVCVCVYVCVYSTILVLLPSHSLDSFSQNFPQNSICLLTLLLNCT